MSNVSIGIWLINDMSSSDADWKFVLMHRAMYSEGKNINKPDTIIMRNVLGEIFADLDIDFVYAGHDHVYYRSHPVIGDEVVKDVTYVTENYKGEEITFANNPDGTVHILPSTAGTKRYGLNDTPIDPIKEACAFDLSTRDMGGCFMTTVVDGDKVIIKSYLVDDETEEISLIDQYAIKKDLSQKPDIEATDLPTDNISNIGAYISNIVTEIVGMLYSYIAVLLPQAMIDFAGITKNVITVGCGKYAEIWAEERWIEQKMGEEPENYAETLARLGL